LSGAEVGQEFCVGVVDVLPFGEITRPWAGVFGAVFLVGSETLLNDRNDFGRRWIVAGDVNAHTVATRFERRDFGVLICTVHMRAFVFTAWSDAASAEAD
jgi:hypothetical protein